MQPRHVPTSEQFREFAAVTRIEWGDRLKQCYSSIDASADAVEGFFREWSAYEHARRANARTTVVWSWFQSEPSFSRAMYASDFWAKAPATHELGLSEREVALRIERAVRRLRPTAEQLRDRWQIYRRLRKSAEPMPFPVWVEQELQPDSLKQQLQSHLHFSLKMRDPMQLYRRIALAFAHYHGGGVEADLERKAALLESTRILDEIKGLVDGKLTQAFERVGFDDRRRPGALHLGKRVDFLMRRVDAIQKELMPSFRNDETLPERILLWQLRSAFYAVFDADKPTALFYMLGVSGVRRPLDKRTIERLLSSWRTARQ